MDGSVSYTNITKVLWCCRQFLHNIYIDPEAATSFILQQTNTENGRKIPIDKLALKQAWNHLKTMKTVANTSFKITFQPKVLLSSGVVSYMELFNNLMKKLPENNYADFFICDKCIFAKNRR